MKREILTSTLKWLVTVNKVIIESVKNKLIETYQPLEIYLFGSYAWGVPHEESDLDLLTVVDDCEDADARHKMLVQGYLALSQFRIPKDIMLFSKEEFNEMSCDTTTLCYKIKRQGMKIYAKA